MKRIPLLLSMIAATAMAAGAAPPAPPDTDPHIPNEKYQLDNGMEVILHQDNRAPVVFVDLWYHVGSGDEVPGKSGFAHIFEHMMFQGTKHTGDDMHFKILHNIGASEVNATTNTDRTNFFEQVPSNQLETALWLESDRMGFLLDNLDEKQLDNQRDVVRNERRQSYDNTPYGATRFALFKALYADGHPYRNLTIGLHEDVQGASVDDVKAFFRKWYVPSNCTLVIAGDFQTADAKALVQKWFGTFPKLAKPERKMVPPTALTAPVKQTITDPFAKLRRVEWAWHSPAEEAPGDAELDIVANALGRQGTGRLYKALVLDKQLAQNVSVMQQDMRMSSIFRVVVTLRDGTDIAEVEKIVQGELDKITKQPITAEELNRVIASNEALTTWGLEDIQARAEMLQSCNQMTGMPDCITQDFDRYRNTTVEKVRDVAAATLNPNTVVELITMPAAAAVPPATPASAPAAPKGGK
jgi:predicted Zn-dependent peptidase